VRFAAAMPVLIVDPGEIPVFVASFIRNMMLLGCKGPTATKAAHALGLLYDFYVIEKQQPDLDERALQMLIKQFYEARRYGCEGLGWKPVSLKTALDDLEHIRRFSTFCHENYGHIPVTERELILISSLSSRNFNLWLAQARARKRFDLLFHIYNSTQHNQSSVNTRVFKPDHGKPMRVTSAKYFPPDRVRDFIERSANMRDLLCWLLLFYGGLRISELLHIYVRDIDMERKTGMARVVLADPRDGKIAWTAVTGQQQFSLRADFLARRYRKIPRHDLGAKHPERAGWKGMKYEDQQNRESFVYWSDPQAGQLFWKLHVQYMREIRLRIPDRHPYYFVSIKGDVLGQPLKLKNLREQFYDTAKRIGLARNQSGVNPHGARHFYGYFCATHLRFSKEKLQVMMHHRSIISTEIYYALDSKVVRDELERAHLRMLTEVPEYLRAPSSDSIKKEKEND